MAPTRPSLLFFMPFLLPLIHASTISSCSYFSGAPCLPNVDGSGSGTFSFKPLFPSEVKMVVAYDSMNQSEADAQLIDFSSIDRGPYNKVGAWVEYSSDKLDASADDVTDMILFVLNATDFRGRPGGGNNGCDAVWGAACSKEIRTKLPEAVVTQENNLTAENGFLKEALPFLDFTKGNTNCVPRMWSGRYGVGIGEAVQLSILTVVFSQVVATETSATTPKIIASGSLSKNWFTLVTAKSAPDLFVDALFVGVIARAPSVVVKSKGATADQVQVEFVCVQPEKGVAGLKSSGCSSSSSSFGIATGSASGSVNTGGVVLGVQMAGLRLFGTALLAALGIWQG